MARRKKTFDDYLKAAIRRIWGWSDERKAASRRCERNGGKERFCEECLQWFPRKQTQIDHVVPVDNPEGWDGWSAYIVRMRAPADTGLRCLCSACHQKKSNAENARRRARKKESK